MTDTRGPLRHILLSAVLLGLFGMVGTALVAAIHALTAERIAANILAVRMRSLHEVLPPDRHDNDLLADRLVIRDPEWFGKYPATVYRARRAGRPVAAVFEVTTPEGYGGPIRLLVGVDMAGRITGVRVLEHHETPGLGDAVDIERSDWVLGFNGRALGDPPAERFAVKRDGGVFDQFTGATITPRAVVKAVKRVLLYFQAHRDSLFAPTGAPSDAHQLP